MALSQAKQDQLAQERYLKQLELIESGTTLNRFETEKEKAEIIERCKKDPVFFAETMFPHYCSSPSAKVHKRFAKKIARTKKINAFLELGRGHAKSVWVNIIIPSWLWFRGEPMYLVIVSNSYNKAKQLLSDLHAEFEKNERLIHYCGEQKNTGSWEEGFFETKGGFIGQALGLGQNVRGLRVRNLRPKQINCDDAETKEMMKNPQRQDETAEWVEGELMGCFDGPIQRFIWAMNRPAPRMVQTVLQKRHPDWYVCHEKSYDPVTYESIVWPEKYEPQYWKDQEQKMGVLACQAEYNHIAHIEGKIFKKKQIQWASLPRIDHFEAIVGHWDVAYSGTSTSDFNAVRLWGLYKRRFYLIDCYVKQSKMSGAINWMCEVDLELQERTVKDLYIRWQYEAQFWNDEVERTIEEVKEYHGSELNLIQVERPTSNKYDRILSTQIYYQNGRIYYNEDLKSHNDTQQGLAQLLGIEPQYKTKDDAPDADEAGLKELSSRISSGEAPPPQYGDKYTNKLV